MSIVVPGNDIHYTYLLPWIGKWLESYLSFQSIVTETNHNSLDFSTLGDLKGGTITLFLNKKLIWPLGGKSLSIFLYPFHKWIQNDNIYFDRKIQGRWSLYCTTIVAETIWLNSIKLQKEKGGIIKSKFCGTGRIFSKKNDTKILLYC